MTVNTVTGKVKRSELGITTPHEHVFIDLTAFYEERDIPGISDASTEKVAMDKLGILNRDPYAFCDNLLLDDADVQADELSRFKDAGGKTVVDATMPGIGRDVNALKKVSEKTGLNIVIGTGYYVFSTHPNEIKSMSDEDIASIMCNEIENGIDGTDIKAGVIGEIGISEVFNDDERKVLRAAAIAQKNTGLGVLVHINPWTVNGLESAEILLDKGVDPQRICVCHIDVENREEYILKLLSMGVYVEFDNFGKEYYVDEKVRRPGYGLFVRDTQRVELLKKLIDMGYLSQILLSCDVCLKTLLHKYGGWGYDHVLTNVVPMMREAGITDGEIETMLVKNPADFLCGKE